MDKLSPADNLDILYVYRQAAEGRFPLNDKTDDILHSVSHRYAADIRHRRNRLYRSYRRYAIGCCGYRNGNI